MAGSEVGEGCLTVAGDALHPMTANMGQGGCIALEVFPPSPLAPMLITLP